MPQGQTCPAKVSHFWHRSRMGDPTQTTLTDATTISVGGVSALTLTHVSALMQARARDATVGCDMRGLSCLAMPGWRSRTPVRSPRQRPPNPCVRTTSHAITPSLPLHAVPWPRPTTPTQPTAAALPVRAPWLPSPARTEATSLYHPKRQPCATVASSPSSTRRCGTPSTVCRWRRTRVVRGQMHDRRRRASREHQRSGHCSGVGRNRGRHVGGRLGTGLLRCAEWPSSGRATGL